MEFLEKISPREYQQKIFESCTRKNCLVVLPTGLGKTMIALMLTVERMKKFPGEKVVFLAPTKPLAEQHLSYFKENLPELFGSLELFTGEIVPEKRKELWETSDIIFSTPQCVGNDVSKNLYNLEDVCLLIEDEAHRCIRNYSYNYLAKKYMETSKHSRILGLTASPGSDALKIKEICKNLSIEEVELRTRDSPDVVPYLQELEFEKVILELPKIREALLRLFHRYVDELRNRKVFFGFSSKTELINLQKRLMLSILKGNKNYNNLLASSACAQAVKLQHALELLETQTLQGFNKYLKELFNQAAKKQNKGVIKLVAKPELNFAFVTSEELLVKGQEHPKIEALRIIIEKEFHENEKAKVIVFSQFRETARILCKTLNSIKGVKAKIFVGQAKKAVTGGKEGEVSGLSQKEQKKIINEFSSREINVLCATSIGEEGLDIPEVNVVVFYEPVASAIRAIQRAGRTARLMKGKLVMLITRKTRDEAYFYASKAREKKMHSAINSIKEDMKNGSTGEIQEKLE